MIQRFYVHNFRCLENFDLPIAGRPSSLLIGRNGSGKTSVGLALEILQKIGRGTNRVSDLVKPKDFSHGRSTSPMRMELDVVLDSRRYSYVIAFDLPGGFKDLRVLEESLSVDGRSIYARECAEVILPETAQRREAKFDIDWHLVALPIIQESHQDPLRAFKLWLRRMLILRPIPSLITGESKQDSLEPNIQVTNLGDWFSGLLADKPSAWGRIDKYLKSVMPDLTDVKNPSVGTDSRRLEVQFSEGQASLSVPFADLSDGEKCFMICALVLAANETYGPFLCFWDEPHNYLSLDEVGEFILTLRRGFQAKGQLIATSHNSEAIRKFSAENTLLLQRRSHLEPTVAQLLTDVSYEGDLVGAMIAGDLERNERQ